MQFKEFDYICLEDLKKEATELGLDLNFSDNLEQLAKRVEFEGYTIPNSIVIHPMEGTDSKLDGSPDDLTKRRYERFSRSGAGLIWFEAVAAVPEGRASPRQLWINENNLPEYQRLIESIQNNTRQVAEKELNSSGNNLCIMQLTHSGRYSKPEGSPTPIIAARNPYLDTALGLDKDYPIIEDGELERLEDKFTEAAVLAKRAGFDGVDVKCCHRYLNSELLSAFTRKGRYGETFEGRTRFLLNVLGKIKSKSGDGFIVTARINIYDGIPYPYGWGVDMEDPLKYDLTEPIKLVRELYSRGVGIISLTMGTPYFNPHVNRPYDKGSYIPPEPQLSGVARLISATGEIQKAVPDIVVTGAGYSWLRQYSPYLAAGTLKKGLAKLIGYGREAFAYPDFVKDILLHGCMKKDRCCIACGKCTEIMRAGGTAGCVIRDAGVYAPLYKRYCIRKTDGGRVND